MTARLAILRNVFQLLVHESGVPLSLPPSTAVAVADLLRPPRAGEAEQEEEEEGAEGMTPEKLVRLMLLAGDGSMDEADVPPPARVPHETGAEGGDWRAMLPENVRRELEEWEREKERGRGGAGKRRKVE